MALALLGVAGAMSEIFIVCKCTIIAIISRFIRVAYLIPLSRCLSKALPTSTNMDLFIHPSPRRWTQFCICVHVGYGFGVYTIGEKARSPNLFPGIDC